MVKSRPQPGQRLLFVKVPMILLPPCLGVVYVNVRFKSGSRTSSVISANPVSGPCPALLRVPQYTGVRFNFQGVKRRPPLESIGAVLSMLLPSCPFLESERVTSELWLRPYFPRTRSN